MRATKSQEAKLRCFAGKFLNNPQGFPQYFQGRLALRFHIPEVKEPAFRRQFFSEEPGRLPQDFGE